MRTPKLLIVAIDGVQGPKEVETGADGLYKKYSARNGFNKEVQLVFLGRSGKLVKTDLGKGVLTLEEGDKLGIYIVAHCGDLNTAIYQHDLVANIKTKVLDVKAGNAKYTLDKVCLVVCNSAKDATPVLSEGEEGVLMVKFAMLLKNAGLQPRLAGWTGFVTLDDTGKKRILSSANLKEGYASDMSKSREKQKMVYVYDADLGYVRKDLSSWTDKPV
jgi:hypothetical protein